LYTRRKRKDDDADLAAEAGQPVQKFLRKRLG